jgi:hypothetical protein
MSDQPAVVGLSGASDRSLFIDGYFTRRVQAGERPKYGYPANHLPETDGDSMELVTSFVAARAAE